MSVVPGTLTAITTSTDVLSVVRSVGAGGLAVLGIAEVYRWPPGGTGMGGSPLAPRARPRNLLELMQLDGIWRRTKNGDDRGVDAAYQPQFGY